MGKTVTHLIVGLGKGGAETMLYQVLKYRTQQEISHRVVSFGASHYYKEKIQELGIPVTELPLRRRPVSTLFRLPKLLKGTETLCCWMYHANFIGYFAGRLAGVKRIVWCIRHSNLDPALNKRWTLRINTICAHFSRKVNAIVYNGNRARAVHEEAGYYPAGGYVVDNGCDCEEYAPNAAAREDLCRELGLVQGKKIILSVTKDTPIKDIPTFLKAFGLLYRQMPDCVAVLCGIGVTVENERLVKQCEEAGLQLGRDIFFLGMRHDIPALLAACGLYVLHSAGEAFPNALLQAMSCGCLCVATDVGDARRILANDDCVVQPGDAGALSEKMKEVLALPEDAAQKQRVQNCDIVRAKFDIRQIVKSYEELF